MWIFFIILLIAFCFSLWFIVWEIFWLKRKWKIFLFWIFSLFFCCLIFWLIFSYYEYNIITRIIYFFWALATWTLAFTFLLCFPIYIFKIFYKKNFSKNVKISIFLAIILFNFYGIFNWFSTTIREVSIKTEKETSLKWKKIILVADNHYWNIFNAKSAEKFVDLVNKTEAEFVLIAWDLFDWPKIDFSEIAKILWKINKPVYYASWNHEEYGNFAEMISVLKENWIKVLEKETLNFDWFSISWVDYWTNHNEEDFENNLQDLSLSEKNFNILIKHEPKFAEIAWKNGFDLVVFWHSHKGQIWPILHITQAIYWEFYYWVVEKNWNYAITTSWIWSWWPPQRLWSRSEIFLINIE